MSRSPRIGEWPIFRGVRDGPSRIVKLDFASPGVGYKCHSHRKVRRIERRALQIDSVICQKVSMPTNDLLSINTIRTLSMDAVQQANSGHPGTPMAMAPVVYLLWQEFLRFDPEDPIWPNRDRFVLSAGPRFDAALFRFAPCRR